MNDPATKKRTFTRRNCIRVAITGDRGIGCTALAMELGAMLKSRGAAVTFESYDRRAEDDLQRLAETPTAHDWDGFPIVIVDGLRNAYRTAGR